MGSSSAGRLNVDGGSGGLAREADHVPFNGSAFVKGHRKWKDHHGKVQEAWVVDVQFEHPDGRVERVRKASPVNTRRGAEQFERDLRQTLLLGVDRQKRTAVTLAQFEPTFMTYSENNNKPSQVYAKRGVLKNHLLPALGTTPLAKIGLGEVEAYKAKKLREKLSPKTVNNHLAMLRKALNLAVDMGVLPHAPRFKMLRAPKSPFEFLDFEEAERFIAAVAPEFRAMIVVAMKTGLRSGELLALKWEDIDLTAGRLMVRRNLWRNIEGTPKSGQAREVPLSDAVIAALKEHRHLRGPYVFCTESGKRLGATAASRSWCRASVFAPDWRSGSPGMTSATRSPVTS